MDVQGNVKVTEEILAGRRGAFVPSGVRLRHSPASGRGARRQGGAKSRRPLRIFCRTGQGARKRGRRNAGRRKVFAGSAAGPCSSCRLREEGRDRESLPWPGNVRSSCRQGDAPCLFGNAREESGGPEGKALCFAGRRIAREEARDFRVGAAFTEKPHVALRSRIFPWGR